MLQGCGCLIVIILLLGALGACAGPNSVNTTLGNLDQGFSNGAGITQVVGNTASNAVNHNITQAQADKELQDYTKKVDGNCSILEANSDVKKMPKDFSDNQKKQLKNIIDKQIKGEKELKAVLNSYTDTGTVNTEKIGQAEDDINSSMLEYTQFKLTIPDDLKK